MLSAHLLALLLEIFVSVSDFQEKLGSAHVKDACSKAYIFNKMGFRPVLSNILDSSLGDIEYVQQLKHLGVAQEGLN